MVGVTRTFSDPIHPREPIEILHLATHGFDDKIETARAEGLSHGDGRAVLLLEFELATGLAVHVAAVPFDRIGDIRGVDPCEVFALLEVDLDPRALVVNEALWEV